MTARLQATDDGRFSGYASLFGVPDLTGDLVQPGAFVRTLQARGAGGVKLLYQHDPGQPIGRWLSIEEDRKGLRVSGEILPALARGRDALALIRSGILDGLSIGFRTVKARRDVKSGHRRLVEVDLWEISLVTFPMLPGARIDRGADPADLAETVRAQTARVLSFSR